MPRECTICQHAEAEQINRDLAAGVSLRDIESRFNISRSALSRHSAHLVAPTMPVPPPPPVAARGSWTQLMDGAWYFTPAHDVIRTLADGRLVLEALAGRAIPILRAHGLGLVSTADLPPGVKVPEPGLLGEGFDRALHIGELRAR